MATTPAIAMLSRRSIGGFEANVTIEESHTDELTITQHPVEAGASITDHAFANPSQVTIRCGWSNSSVEASQDPEYVANVYAAFLEMYGDRQTIDLITGKRAYSNMLVRSVGIVTDAETETSLMMTATLQQIIIVNTVATTVAPKAEQAEPAKTQPTTDVGAKQTQPAKSANVSALQQGYSALFE